MDSDNTCVYYAYLIQAFSRELSIHHPLIVAVLSLILSLLHEKNKYNCLVDVLFFSSVDVLPSKNQALYDLIYNVL